MCYCAAEFKTAAGHIKHVSTLPHPLIKISIVPVPLFNFSDVSYKTVERLYSDSEVEMAIYNLRTAILTKKGVKNINTCGDRTGYSLTIRKHYASETEKRKDKAKEYSGTKTFVYSFKLLDLESKMYVAYGMSTKSEKEAFDRALDCLRESRITVADCQDSLFLHNEVVQQWKCWNVSM